MDDRIQDIRTKLRALQELRQDSLIDDQEFYERQRLLVDDYVEARVEQEQQKSEGQNHVYISSHPKDRQWLDRLQIVLSPLIRASRIQVWDETQITLGALRDEEIRSSLQRAQIIILLVSADLLNSDFIMNQHLPNWLEMAKQSKIQILWFLVGDCLVDMTPISSFEPIYNRNQPLNLLSTPEQDQALRQIAQRIGELI